MQAAVRHHAVVDYSLQVGSSMKLIGKVDFGARMRTVDGEPGALSMDVGGASGATRGGGGGWSKRPLTPDFRGPKPAKPAPLNSIPNDLATGRKIALACRDRVRGVLIILNKKGQRIVPEEPIEIIRPERLAVASVRARFEEIRSATVNLGGKSRLTSRSESRPERVVELTDLAGA